MGHVLEEDSDMGHGVFSSQLFVHVGLEGESLHIAIFANFDKLFTTLVILIPEVLHDGQNPEHLAVLFHEFFTALFQASWVAGFQGFMRSPCHGSGAIHGVVNAFT